MLVLDHDRAGGYWGAVYVFTAIKGLQVVIDGPVGCENLPVTSVLHYTDALAAARIADRRHRPVRGRTRPPRHRRRDEARAQDARSGSAERRRHRLDRRDDRRRRDARGHEHPALPAAHDRRGSMAVRQPRDDLAVDRVRREEGPCAQAQAARAGRQAARQHHRPVLRRVQHALRSRRDPAAGRGDRRRGQHGLPARQPSRRRRRGWSTPTSTSACTANSAGCCARRSTGPICRRRSACTRTTKFLRALGELLGLDPEPFIEREKHTTIKPIWDLWRSVTQDFFGTASFAIVANETYARGVRHFLEDEMGLPCMFAISRKPGEKTDNEAVREAVRSKTPLVMFGSYNERMYLRRGRRARDVYSRLVPRRDHSPPHRHAVHGLCRRDLPHAGSLQRAVRRAVPHPAARRPTSTRSRRRRRGCIASSRGRRTPRRCSTRSSRRARCSCAFPPPSACATRPSARRAGRGEDRVRRRAGRARARIVAGGERRMTLAKRIRDVCSRVEARPPGGRDHV